MRHGLLLLVVAHPDDELLFFGPLLLDQAPRGRAVVLCLSDGGYGGRGGERRRELAAVCAGLGAAVSPLSFAFRDSPQTYWDAAAVARVVGRAVSLHRPDLLVSFGPHGQTGHRNHVSVHQGLRAYLHRQSKGDATTCTPKVAVLEDIPVPLRYIGPLSRLVALIPGLKARNSYTIVTTRAGRKRLRHLMALHRTQYNLLRWLAIRVSSVLYVARFSVLLSPSPRTG